MAIPSLIRQYYFHYSTCPGNELFVIPTLYRTDQKENLARVLQLPATHTRGWGWKTQLLVELDAWRDKFSPHSTRFRMTRTGKHCYQLGKTEIFNMFLPKCKLAFSTQTPDVMHTHAHCCVLISMQSEELTITGAQIPPLPFLLLETECQLSTYNFYTEKYVF